MLKTLVRAVRNASHQLGKEWEDHLLLRELRGETQNALFEKADLDYPKALSFLRQVYAKYPYLEETSEHHKLFAALSSSAIPIDKILEIGTHAATGTELLAHCFEQSDIVTIDLEESSQAFQQSYGRKRATTRRQFIEARDKRLATLSRATFLERNSLGLALSDGEFDFIWIDGAHNLPVVASDITNAVRLVSERGIFAVDDVYIAGPDRDIYRSSGAFMTLQEFSRAGIISFQLIHKRSNSRFQAARNTKFIAIARKIRPS